MKLFFALLLPVFFLSLMTSQALAGSGLRYGYYRMNTDYEYYGGLRSKNVKLNVHEFMLSDASGEFSAGLQTAGNQMAAEAGAINEENRKIEKGESVGGPKVLNYEYEKAQAVSGDARIYGLRLGSSENAFSGKTFFGDSADDGLTTYAEIFLALGLGGGSLLQSDLFSLSWASSVSFRFGGIKQTDKAAMDSEDKFRDASFLYVPVSGQLIASFPFRLRTGVESGLDPFTLYRQKLDNTAIPLDLYFAAFAEYRTELFGFGLNMERYRGSIITGRHKPVKHPVYQHQMIGAYAVLGM